MAAGPTSGDHRPEETWAGYRTAIGDRSELFTLLVRTWAVERALYPGSYLDLAPSTAVPSVTYVDTDRRVGRYFADEARVRAELRGRTRPGAGDEVRFLAADYRTPLPVPRSGFDLLISLYAGPVWDHCRDLLRPGGLLLANASHGDASLAALDPALRLLAAVTHRAGRYRLDADALERYLVPKNPRAADATTVRSTGRGVAYTRPAFGYVFRLVGDQ